MVLVAVLIYKINFKKYLLFYKKTIRRINVLSLCTSTLLSVENDQVKCHWIIILALRNRV